jgi:hypothetical protein
MCAPWRPRVRAAGHNCALPAFAFLFFQNPNLEHMLQTAESMRAAGLPDWMQLVGLLHDMGKIMFLWGDRETGQEVGSRAVDWLFPQPPPLLRA